MNGMCKKKSGKLFLVSFFSTQPSGFVRSSNGFFFFFFLPQTPPLRPTSQFGGSLRLQRNPSMPPADVCAIRKQDPLGQDDLTGFSIEGDSKKEKKKKKKTKKLHPV